MFIDPTEVRRLLDNLEDGRAEYDESDAISDLNDAAEAMAEKIVWLYEREPEHAEEGVHESQWWKVHPLIGGVNAQTSFDLSYDEAEDYARAILRVVEDGRKKEQES